MDAPLEHYLKRVLTKASEVVEKPINHQSVQVWCERARARHAYAGQERHHALREFVLSF